MFFIFCLIIPKMISIIYHHSTIRICIPMTFRIVIINNLSLVFYPDSRPSDSHRSIHVKYFKGVFRYLFGVLFSPEFLKGRPAKVINDADKDFGSLWRRQLASLLDMELFVQRYWLFHPRCCHWIRWYCYSWLCIPNVSFIFSHSRLCNIQLNWGSY